MPEKKAGKHGKTARFSIRGELTLDSVNRLKTSLSDLLSGYRSIEVEFRDFSHIDLSGLQILCSAHKSAVKQGKSLILTGELPEAVKTLARDAGFYRHKGCVHDPRNRCLRLLSKESGGKSKHE